MQGSRTERRRRREGREERFSTRVACKTEEKGGNGVDRGEKIKIKNIYFNYSGIVHFKLS